MNARTGPLLIVGAACLAAGIALGWFLRSPPAPAAAPAAAAPAPRNGRVEELLAENASLRERLAAARRDAAARAVAEAAPAPAPAEAETSGSAHAAPEDDGGSGEEARAAALRDLESVEYELSADPTNADLLARFVDAAAKAGEIDRAIARFEKLEKEHPENPDVQSEFGRALLAKTRDTKDLMEQGKYAFSAVAKFDRALELNPEHFRARLLRGATNYHMPAFTNRLGSAIGDFEALVKQGGGRGDDDRYASAYAWLARSYRKAGRDADAKKTLEEGLRLYPSDPGLSRVSEGR